MLKNLAKTAIASTLGGPALASATRKYRDMRLLRKRRQLILKPTDPRFLEILANPRFQRSVEEVKDITEFDTARLANLWQLCSMSGPGNIVDVGTYKGATTMHLSNCQPDRLVLSCDTFDGLVRVELHGDLDRRFSPSLFSDAAPLKELRQRLNGRKVEVLVGLFPSSDEMQLVRNVSFAHIDVVVYSSCRESLSYLAERSVPGAIFVVNDYLRQSPGIDKAVADFVMENRGWSSFPAYPGQAVLSRRV